MSSIIIFQDVNYRGAYLRTEKNIEDLATRDFDNKIQSIIVCEGTWQLFENPGYGGEMWTVEVDGGPNADGLYPKSTKSGSSYYWRHDRVSSIRPAS